MPSGVRAKASVVLLVEDKADVSKLYAAALRRSGFVVHEVTTIRTALDLAAMLDPDLVLLDRTLPDGDGWDVARALKANEATRHASIVAFTMHRERADVESALVAG